MRCSKIWFILFFFAFTSPLQLRAQHHAANVLYANWPLPITVGIEIGTTLTTFQNATPTFFPVIYPYSSFQDTIHLRFPNGFTPLFGFHAGIAADFAIGNSWGLLTKLNYNERRGNWHASTTTQCQTATVLEDVPLTNDLTLLLRYLTLELYLRHSFESLHDFYLGGGLAYNTLLSNHYDITQELGGPPECTFIDVGTNRATGIRKYQVGNSFGSVLSKGLGEIKLLAGIPIHIGYRWTLNPEITFAYPFTQLFSSTARQDYQSNGIPSTPNPITFAGILGLRYEL